MARFFLLLLLMGGAFLLLNGVGLELEGIRFELPFGGDPTGTRLEGRTVRLETDRLEVRYSRIEPLSGSFMVFGGDGQQRSNALAHATLAGLPMRHARVIHARHPDFHMCGSPGAARAQDLTESMSFVAADASARDGLVETLRLHDERVRSGGERTCVSVEGARLVLDSIHAKPDGRDLTHEFPPAVQRLAFYLAEEVEVADCVALLR